MSINNTNYRKDEDLYFLSVWDNRECRHIRSPYMKNDQIRFFMKEFVSDFPRYTQLEVFNENTLDIASDYKLDTGEKKELTLRQVLFNNDYQEFRDDIKKDPSLLDQYWHSPKLVDS